VCLCVQCYDCAYQKGQLLGPDEAIPLRQLYPSVQYDPAICGESSHFTVESEFKKLEYNKHYKFSAWRRGSSIIRTNNHCDFLYEAGLVIARDIST